MLLMAFDFKFSEIINGYYINEDGSRGRHVLDQDDPQCRTTPTQAPSQSNNKHPKNRRCSPYLEDKPGVH